MQENKSLFIDTCDTLEKHYAELKVMMEQARQLNQLGMHDSANAVMNDMAELGAKITLLTRELPTLTGNPEASAAVEAAVAATCPVEIGFTEDGWFLLKMQPLARNKEYANKEYIRGILYPAMERFWKDKDPARCGKSTMIFRHVYDRERPEERFRDYGTPEGKAVADIVAMYVLTDDSPFHCSHFHCSTPGTKPRTEVYVVPQEDFSRWLKKLETMPDESLPVLDAVPKRWKVNP